MPKLLQKQLKKNIDVIKQMLHNTSDLKMRDVKVATIPAVIVYIDALINTKVLQDSIITPLNSWTKTNTAFAHTGLIQTVCNEVIEVADLSIKSGLDEITQAIVQGEAVLFVDGFDEAILINVVQWQERNIEQSISEHSMRGPMIGFTEKIKSNINLLRGIIKSPNLCIETKEIGSLSKTTVSILYLEGVVDNEVLSYVRQKLKALNIKYVQQARIIEDSLEGKKSIFDLIGITEKPDVAASNLYSGKVIILVDGTPFALISPHLFIEIFQTHDEYYTKYGRLSSRLLRFIGLLITLYAPAVFVIVGNFHKNDISSKLFKVLFPADMILTPLWAMILLHLLAKVLVDISFHIPLSAMLLISLAGTITVGESAIKAKLVSPFEFVIIGITLLSAFLITNKSITAITTLRLTFILIGNFFDFVGLIVTTTILIIYMVNLKSAGVPYCAPLIPFKPRELKDTLYRGELKKLINSKHSYLDDK